MLTAQMAYHWYMPCICVSVVHNCICNWKRDGKQQILWESCMLDKRRSSCHCMLNTDADTGTSIMWHLNTLLDFGKERLIWQIGWKAWCDKHSPQTQTTHAKDAELLCVCRLCLHTLLSHLDSGRSIQGLFKDHLGASHQYDHSIMQMKSAKSVAPHWKMSTGNWHFCISTHRLHRPGKFGHTHVTLQLANITEKCSWQAFWSGAHVT